jgi:protein-S-isoprenylcysteine O-methyltransferase Ste14
MSRSYYLIMAVAWILWNIPFFVFRPANRSSAKVDSRARWGMLVQSVAYWIVFAGPFWKTPPQPWRVAASTVFFAMGCGLIYLAMRNLGKQWRIDAGLNTDHQLVRTGPYAIIRHPIYASMGLMLLGSGFMIAPLWRLAIAIVIFIAGTEVRVRIEDGLLRSRFGEQFEEYRRSVRAYIPLVR